VNAALNNPAAGYPIAGYTYWLLPTCYATAAEATKVIDFLEAHLNQSGSETTLVDDIESNGFMPVPGVTDSNKPATGSYAAAILSVFVTGDTQHLNIASVGASGGNATRCTSAAGR
jgi:phosphate transport system substrate-binding protein